MLSGGKKESADSGGAKAALLIAEKTTKNESLCKSMSLTNRVKGWLLCLAIGTVVTFLSSSTLKNLTNGTFGLVKFAVFYIIGTSCALLSSFFLWGPAK